MRLHPSQAAAQVHDRVLPQMPLYAIDAVLYVPALQTGIARARHTHLPQGMKSIQHDCVYRR